MNKQKTIVNFVLDKSGSMESVREATISGFNEYIQTLKKDENNDYDFLLTLFDNTSETQIARPIKEVSELNKDSYIPNGGTALYDAVCRTIMKTKDLPDQKVITIIMTDGDENSSVEFNQESMKTLIKDREAKGTWKFVYLGANQDSYANAQKFGINKNATVNFNATFRGMSASMSTMGGATMAYATSATDNKAAFFTEKDKKDIEETK